MGLHGAAGEVQQVGYLGVGAPFGGEGGDAVFAVGEGDGAGAGRRRVACPALAQGLGGEPEPAHGAGAFGQSGRLPQPGAAPAALPCRDQLAALGEERRDQLRQGVAGDLAQGVDGFLGQFQAVAAAGGGAEDAQGAADSARRAPHPGEPHLLRRQVQRLLAAAEFQPAGGHSAAPRGDDGADHLAGGLPPPALQEVVDRPRQVAGGGPQHTARVEEAVQLPAVRRRVQVEAAREVPCLVGASGVHQRHQHMGVLVGGDGAGPARAPGPARREQAGVVAAGGGDVRAGVEQGGEHRVEQAGVLPREPPLDQPVRLVELVGPVGDGGGGADEEGLGERIGGLGEQLPHPAHRLGRRDERGRRGVPDEERLARGAHQFGERSPVSQSQRYTSCLLARSPSETRAEAARTVRASPGWSESLPPARRSTSMAVRISPRAARAAPSATAVRTRSRGPAGRCWASARRAMAAGASAEAYSREPSWVSSRCLRAPVSCSSRARRR